VTPLKVPPFEFWDGREPVVVAEDVLIEPLVIETPS
jgi:hypothetical protein